jgi:hypothetical protein
LPSVSALKTAVQVELELLAGASVHVGVTVAVEPAGWLVTLKLTVPRGALFVPEAVSLTVAVQVAGVLAGVEAGQSSVVEVERIAGRRATSWATQSAACPAVAVLFPVEPGVACVKSAAIDIVCAVAPPMPPESTVYLKVMPDDAPGVSVVLLAMPKKPTTIASDTDVVTASAVSVVEFPVLPLESSIGLLGSTPA